MLGKHDVPPPSTQTTATKGLEEKMKLRIHHYVLFLLTLATPLVHAENESNVFKGYLTDQKCAEAVKEDSDPIDFLKQHTKDCALMPNCKKDGYVLYCNREWLKLDKNGNNLAVGILKASNGKRGYYVEVKGTRQKDLLKTESIKEVAEPQEK